MVVMLFIPALVGIFGNVNLIDNLFQMSILLSVIFVLVPYYIIPNLYMVLDRLWYGVSTKINIGRRPSELSKDFLYPVFSIIVCIYLLAAI
jgi:hypothetical protein